MHQAQVKRVWGFDGCVGNRHVWAKTLDNQHSIKWPNDSVLLQTWTSRCFAIGGIPKMFAVFFQSNSTRFDWFRHIGNIAMLPAKAGTGAHKLTWLHLFFIVWFAKGHDSTDMSARALCHKPLPEPQSNCCFTLLRVTRRTKDTSLHIQKFSSHRFAPRNDIACLSLASPTSDLLARPHHGNHGHWFTVSRVTYCNTAG